MDKLETRMDKLEPEINKISEIHAGVTYLSREVIHIPESDMPPIVRNAIYGRSKWNKLRHKFFYIRIQNKIRQLKNEWATNRIRTTNNLTYLPSPKVSLKTFSKKFSQECHFSQHCFLLREVFCAVLRQRVAHLLWQKRKGFLDWSQNINLTTLECYSVRMKTTISCYL